MKCDRQINKVSMKIKVERKEKKIPQLGIWGASWFAHSPKSDCYAFLSGDS